MPIINLFRSEFVTQPKTINVENGKAIKDCLDIDFDYSIIYVNGFKVDKEYILKENDVCTVRQLSAGGIASGIDSMLHGKSFEEGWHNHWNNVKRGFEWFGGQLHDFFFGKEDKKDEPATNNPDTTTQTIPQLAGAKNSSAYGKNVPLVLGRSIFTPSYCGNQYRTISGTDGENQTFHCLYMLGYNNIEVKDIKLGMSLLSSNPNNITSGKFSKANGDYEGGRWDAETYHIQMELQQVNPCQLYNEKVTEEQLNIELINTNGTDKLVAPRFSAKYPKKVEVEFTLNGLIGYSDSGEEQNKSVQIKILASYDGGQNYVPFEAISGDGITYDSSTGISTITRKKNKVMRFVAVKDFNKYPEDKQKVLNLPDGVIEFQISRENQKDTGNNVFDTVYLSGIRTWSYDPKADNSNSLQSQKPVDTIRQGMTARLALEIQADETEFKGQLEALNCILTAKGRTYSNGSWSSTLSPTTNPASMALLLLQHPSRGKYAYTDSQIDMDAFGEFYNWCNQPRIQGVDNTPKFQCNGVITNKKKTREYLTSIIGCGRAMFLMNGRKISLWIDKPRTIPVMVLNNQNILPPASNSKDLDDIPDGYKCKFVNERTWQSDEWEIPISNPMPSNPMYETMDMLFQTNEKQVWQNARYAYAVRKLRPESWRRKVSVDGNLIDYGSLVEIQDDTISVGIGDGAEIKELVTDNGYITQIKTDGNMYIDDLTQEYGIKVTCADGVHEPKVMTYKVVPSATGEQSVFTFDTPILESATYKPNEGDIISFGFLDRITTQALCFGKKDNGDGTFDLTLVPYQEGIYTADSGEIPKFKTNVSDIPQRDRGSYEVDKTAERFAEVNQKIDEIETGSADIGEPDDITGLSAIAKQDRISISWNPLGNGLQNTIKRYYVEIKKGNGNWQSLPSTTANTTEYIFNRNTDGYPEYSVLDTWKVRVKAENIYGVLAEDWTVADVNTNSYGTWIPASLSFDAKIPDEGGITFSWSRPTSSISGRTLYGTPRYTVTVKYADTDHSIAEQVMGTLVTSALTTKYNFDRDLSKDGYPEKVATASYKGLDKYTFILSVQNESGNLPVSSSAVTFTPSELNNYKTWIPSAPVITKKIAEENGITFEWNDVSTCYGNNHYTIVIPDAEGTIPQSLGATRFYYTFLRESNGVMKDGYPEPDELIDWDFTVKAVNNQTGRESTGSVGYVDVSEYLGWLPNAPVVQSRSSGRTCTVSPSNAERRYGKIMYKIMICNPAIDREEEEGEVTYKYYLPTPTADPFGAETNYKNASQENVPILSDSPYSQTMPLKDQSATKFKKYSFVNADDPLDYDNGTTKLLIYTETQPPATAIQNDVYIDGVLIEDAYCWTDSGTNFISFEVSMPSPKDTIYWWKIASYNAVTESLQSKTSAYTDAQTTAFATSAYDVVKAGITENALAPDAVTTDKIAAGTITANKIFVEALSAISANLGAITDGSLVGNQNNYWYLSDEYDEQHQLIHRAGDFRVGGATGDFISCSTSNGTDYNIEIQASQFNITAIGTVVKGAFYVAPFNATIDPATGIPSSYYARIDSNGVSISGNASIEGDLSVTGRLNNINIYSFNTPDNTGYVLIQDISKWYNSTSSSNTQNWSMNGVITAVRTGGYDASESVILTLSVGWYRNGSSLPTGNLENVKSFSLKGEIQSCIVRYNSKEYLALKITSVYAKFYYFVGRTASAPLFTNIDRNASVTELYNGNVTMTGSVTANSRDLVTSGGVKTALNSLETSVNNSLFNKRTIILYSRNGVSNKRYLLIGVADGSSASLAQMSADISILSNDGSYYRRHTLHLDVNFDNLQSVLDIHGWTDVLLTSYNGTPAIVITKSGTTSYLYLDCTDPWLSVFISPYERKLDGTFVYNNPPTEESSLTGTTVFNSRTDRTKIIQLRTDTTPVANSLNLITSGAVATAFSWQDITSSVTLTKNDSNNNWSITNMKCFMQFNLIRIEFKIKWLGTTATQRSCDMNLASNKFSLDANISKIHTLINVLYSNNISLCYVDTFAINGWNLRVGYTGFIGQNVESTVNVLIPVSTT